MHNRKPDGIASREIGLRDGLVLAPLVLCILGLALYPQLILQRTAPTVEQTISAVNGGEAPEAQLAENGAGSEKKMVAIGSGETTRP
jgi:NADH:ubiquinone oxidoreductase subunit 4 (subunit M)